MYDNLEMGYSTENLINSNLCLYNLISTFLFPDKHVNEKKQDAKDMIHETVLYLQGELHKALMVEDMAKKNNLSASHFSSLLTFIPGNGCEFLEEKNTSYLQTKR